MRSKKCTNWPVALFGWIKPSESRAKPLASQQNCLASQPHRLTGQPNLLASQPNRLASQPNLSAGQPNPLASQPNLSASQPKPLASQPKLLASQPKLLANQPTPTMLRNTEQFGLRAGQALAIALGCALLLLLPTVAFADEPEKNVLIFNSDDVSRPANVLIDRAIRSTLKEQWKSPIQIYDEGQDSFRIPNEKYEAELVALLKRKYEGTHLDLIFVPGPPALRFLLKYRSELFPEVPLVFMSTDQSRVADLDLGANVTGVSTKVEVVPTLELALTFHPQTQRVVVVAGNASIDRGLLALAQKEFRPYESRVAFTYLTDLSPEEMRRRLAVLPDRTVVIFLAYSVDPTGKNYFSGDVISLLASSSTAPIYGQAQTFLGFGIVGGQLLSYEALGLSAAQLGLRILRGENPQSIAPQTLPNVPMFDWRQLRRWNIAEARLPPGSVVRYKQFSAWELYKWRIIGAISLIVLQALLIAWLLVLRSRRRQAELASERFASQAALEHKRLDEVVSNVPGVVWEARFEPGSTVRRAEFVSPYVERLLGYSVEEWLSKPDFVRSITHEDDRRRVAAEGEAIIASGKEGILQCRWLAKNGDVLWVEAHLAAICDEDGKTIGLRGVTMNITDRKQAEAALTENRAQLAGIIDTAIDAIISIDERQRVVLFNPAAEQMFGCNADRALGQPLNRFVPTPFRDAQEAHRSSLKETHRGGFSIASLGALYGRRADGEDFPVEVSISQLELRGHNYYTIILRDVTERVRAEAALRERKQELSEAQRVAKVGSWEWDPATDTVTWSEEMFRIVGRDPSLAPINYEDHPALYTPESWVRLQAAVDKALQHGRPYELELQMIRTDGRPVWTSARGEVLKDETGRVLKLRGTLQDIAERKQAEEDLQRAVAEVSQLKNQLQEENIYLQEEIKLAHNFNEIVGRSDATKYVLFKIEQVAPTDTTVLITGETGTGKELVAHAIHGASARRDRPLVKLNCAALSPTLIESELFGHEKGAFTGATARKIGRFELANAATIFLDEIGELPLELQVKLLRVIQEGEFERLGSSKTIKVDARIIAATNRNLKTAVEQGAFREDLWYRLNVFPITVPPLRDRKEDIPGLVEHFVRRFSQKVGKGIFSIPPASLRILLNYSWPGNVRELANVLERAVINTNGAVLRIVDHFEQPHVDGLAQTDKTLEEMEKEYITRILDSTGWRIEGRKGAARILGLNPSTLRTRMSKLGIQKAEQGSSLASAAR
jgi:PAS domain S-box-containing protein